MHEYYSNLSRSVSISSKWDAQFKGLLVTRAATFSAYMNTQRETCQQTSAQCLLDGMLPNNTAAYDPPRSCAQGSIPSYYVDVAKVSDVQVAVMFAKTNSIPLVIKNSGGRLQILCISSSGLWPLADMWQFSTTLLIEAVLPVV
ncbi:hypothetical protein JVT61DRAFT_5012 [Boletus reticuloceps]|uniref:FAD linked oxidase N-terminal domain-containing protein n=1 Tax=Boletus reticuloceps TaxID=495285 RepID=A0A8I3AFN3_9AGAM|nr:hypothetical protein JVT61DRAFT_5012 [Boletus reticuloceps]